MKILVVDDHQIVLEGLAAFLSRGLRAAVLTAPDVEAAFALLRTHTDFDLILLDLTMPGLASDTALKEIARIRPDIPIIVLSASEDPNDVKKVLNLGALGFVPKSASSNTLLCAIDLAMKGEIYLPPLVLPTDVGAPRARPQKLVDKTPRLTERQVEVLRLVNEGHSNKAIAALLNLSEKTVKIHIGAIFRALAVDNRTQAAAAARRAGLI